MHRTAHSAAYILALIGAATSACSSGGTSSSDDSIGSKQSAVTTITISGRVAYNGYPALSSGLLAGVTVTLSGARSATTVTDANGNYSFTGLPTGTYSVRATMTGVSMLPDVVNLASLTSDSVQRFYATPSPGAWAPSRVFGQVDLTTAQTNMVVPNRVFHPGGVTVDRMPAPTPSRMWVFDAGNDRILGFKNVGTCVGGSTPGANCTEHSGCGTGGSCSGSLNRNADIVLGQPSSSDRNACNGDATKRAPAARNTLCLTPFPLQVSLAEGPQGGQMATDNAHNLYLVDPYNNRVLRYDDPFTKDNLPDKVWGQGDYTSRECNRGFGAPAGDWLCTGDLDSLGTGFYSAGVDVLPDGSAIWVADNANNRVLRIPTSGTTANLVLGQPDMVTNNGCDGTLGTLCNPKAVRFDPATNRLYVADGLGAGSRVLVYQNPTTNGQAATTQYLPPAGSSFNSVRGLTLDPATAGAVWLSDTDNGRLLQYINGTLTRVLGQKDFTSTDCWWANFPTDTGIDGAVCSPHGSIGIDRDGSVYTGDMGGHQRVDRYPGPQPLPRSDGWGHGADALLLNSGNIVGNMWGVPNHIGPAGFDDPDQVVITPQGLIVADRFRLLIWSNYTASGLNAGPANVVLGQPDFTSEDRYYTTHGNVITSVVHDATRNLLYAVEKDNILVWSTQSALTTGQQPSFVISSPLALRGGGNIDFRANGLAVDPATDSAWLADTEHHRIMRILNLSQSATRQVDVVLGQSDINSTQCYRGAGQENPTRNGFCIPDQITFDRLGNLYVVESAWEAGGRAVEFDKTSLPAIPSPQLFWSSGGPLPTRVYGETGFTTRDCNPDRVNYPCTPRSLSFEPGTNRMVMTVDGYDNPLESRAFYYNNPVPSGVTAPAPSGRIPLPFNQGGSSAFDSAGRLALLDHTWSRVVLINTPPH
ncbi:MAG: carboxypeptidase regulatory-like domain-containing protein [Polyangiaceae bacterium]